MDRSIAGPQRRVATRKRSLTNTNARSNIAATKKPKGADSENSERPHRTHTWCNSSTVHNPSGVHSAETQPSFAEGMFLADHSDGSGNTEQLPLSSNCTAAVSNSPAKIHSEIETIPHKKPLFKAQSRNNGNQKDSTLSSGGCISHGAAPKGTQVPNSPLVWPDDANDEEDWRLAAEIDCQNSRSARRAASQRSTAVQEEDTSFCSSPLPPTPQVARLKATRRLSSVKLHATPHAAGCSQTQNNSFTDWDSEDSFYDKLDLDQLIADSQTSDVGWARVSSKHDLRANGEWHEASSLANAGDCPSENEKLSPQSQAHQGSTQDKTRKCSASTDKVQTNSHIHAPQHPDKEEIRNSDANSVTSKQEKWFSHLGEKTGSMVQNSGCHANLRSISKTETAEKQSFTSQVQSSGIEKPLADPQMARLSHQGDSFRGFQLGSTGQSSHTELTTPKVTPGATRLRQRLQNNARVVTPQQMRHTELRQAKVQEALTEMLEESNGIKDNDIGPFYGLPSKVAELLKSQRGINKLYDWQHSCLTLPAIQEGRNLIYSLPTSGGKTLVAEILIMRQLLCNKKDALLILPFVSIVQEKVVSLSTFAIELGFLVEEYAGSKGAIPPRKHRKKKTLYIATIEKAHSLVNSLILEGRVESLGLVVVDELHMLGDGGRRGASLEACIAKLLHLNSAHIIGMSATLSNIQDLCIFMRAEVYCSDFRPVELKEYIKIEDNIFEVNQSALCPDDRFTHSRILTFPYTQSMRKNDPDHLVGLALEVIPVHSCLIFCATKKSCQNVAEFICKHMPKNEAKKLMHHRQEEKRILLLSLRRECDNHLCPTLKRTVPYGLAYHHSGLTMDERKLIEDAYSDGTLCLLTCTSTLAAGVNLPARRVILRSPYIAQELLTSTRYKQMVGRAGRAGIDSSGESILIIKHKEKKEIAELLSQPIEACYSSLTHDDGKGIRSLILTLIALKLTMHRKAVLDFMNQTLFGIQASRTGSDVSTLTSEGLGQLLELKLVSEKPCDQSQHAGEPELTVTKLGRAAFKGSIDIDLCASIYVDLKQACDEGLVLANSLHLLYLVTPYDLVSMSNPNWVIYDRLYSNLNDGDLRVAELVGVTDKYLNFKVAGRKTHRTNEETDFHVRRFYLTLMLWMILNQTGIWDVAAKFEVPRGFVQNLFTSAASFGSSIQRFCEDLPEFWAYQQLLTKVVYDLTYCATADLVSLLEVPGVKQGRAKQLVRAGYKTIRHLAHADPKQLVQEVEHLPKRVAQEIVAAAKMELAERAEALREEAEELVTKPEDEKEMIMEDEPREIGDSSWARHSNTGMVAGQVQQAQGSVARLDQQIEEQQPG
ncbi:helicase POLQ-like isoform X2 [Acanthaster planci]|uniref:Helicase POLQ-like isoform X2 n=1 Tax=Acanthaster planci TaxID=133434 RepID=A0A8B7YHJ4_ACAPL|nr:helicase POLQ-like isoform X2 [Acanthaster planci]